MIVKGLILELLLKWFSRRIPKNLKILFENNYVIHMTKEGYTAHTQDMLCSVCCHNCNLTKFDPERWTIYVDERQEEALKEEVN